MRDGRVLQHGQRDPGAGPTDARRVYGTLPVPLHAGSDGEGTHGTEARYREGEIRNGKRAGPTGLYGLPRVRSGGRSGHERGLVGVFLPGEETLGSDEFISLTPQSGTSLPGGSESGPAGKPGGGAEMEQSYPARSLPPDRCTTSHTHLRLAQSDHSESQQRVLL